MVTNLTTNETTTYSSVLETSRMLNITSKTITKHIRYKTSYNNYLFNYVNNGPSSK